MDTSLILSANAAASEPPGDTTDVEAPIADTVDGGFAPALASALHSLGLTVDNATALTERAPTLASVPDTNREADVPDGNETDDPVVEEHAVTAAGVTPAPLRLVSDGEPKIVSGASASQGSFGADGEVASSGPDWGSPRRITLASATATTLTGSPDNGASVEGAGASPITQPTTLAGETSADLPGAPVPVGTQVHTPPVASPTLAAPAPDIQVTNLSHTLPSLDLKAPLLSPVESAPLPDELPSPNVALSPGIEESRPDGLARVETPTPDRRAVTQQASTALDASPAKEPSPAVTAPDQSAIDEAQAKAPAPQHQASKPATAAQSVEPQVDGADPTTAPVSETPPAAVSTPVSDRHARVDSPTSLPGVDGSANPAIVVSETRPAVADATPSPSVAATVPLDAPGEAALWDQVQRALERVRSDGTGQELQLRLKPAELGDLIVQVRTHGDEVAVRLVATSTSSQQVLLDNRQRLAQELHAAGFTGGYVDISHHDDQPGRHDTDPGGSDRPVPGGGPASSAPTAGRVGPTTVHFGRRADSTINLAL